MEMEKGNTYLKGSSLSFDRAMHGKERIVILSKWY